MKIKKIYERFPKIHCNEGDYFMLKVSEGVFVGFDKDNYTTIAMTSKNSCVDALKQKTKKISLESNQLINYYYNDKVNENIFHIIKCLSLDKKDIDVFLDLCDVFINERSLEIGRLYEIFAILSSFFESEKFYSENELQGLYTELYTIFHYKDRCNFAKCWHSKDKLMFDFSINSKFKLEVKSTVKNSRIHRFNHEQLATKIYDVYVLSYKLREDDSGLSLKCLINECLNIFVDDPAKISKLLNVKYRCSEDFLDTIKYSEEYIINNMRFYNARNIPHFSDMEGVSEATYNSDFENIESLPEDDFFKLISSL